LTFDMAEGLAEGPMMMADQETGSEWIALTGEALEGPLADARLGRFPSHASFWCLDTLLSSHPTLQPVDQTIPLGCGGKGLLRVPA
jgi:hypothetical protein